MRKIGILFKNAKKKKAKGFGADGQRMTHEV